MGLRAIHTSMAKRGLTEVQKSRASKGARLRDHYYMACSRSRYNARSDWLIVGRYSYVMSKGRLRARKNKAKAI